MATAKHESKRDKKRREKPPKPPLTERLLAPFRQAFALGRLLFTRPREFPAAAFEALRLGFRTVWRARGGGLYACGFFVTLIVLEVRTFADEVAQATGVGDFLTGQFVEILLRFSIESLVNTVRALGWPVFIVQISPPIGPLLLGAMFVLFPMTLKKPLERWLFPEGVDEATSNAGNAEIQEESRS